MDPGARIILTEEDDWWVAKDEESGVASQGRTREAALENLDEAVALYHGEIGREPTDEELRELGIDPENNVSGELDSEVFENGWIDLASLYILVPPLKRYYSPLLASILSRM